MKKLGIIGFRGMVGSVLIERMLIENDFSKFHVFLFSTSQAGQNSPILPNTSSLLLDAYNLEELTEMDIIISCQGGEYTEIIHPKIMATDWKGFWIDAASTLRMKDNALIILDPINRLQIENALNNNTKNFIGGNCTVSLMLMALGGLFKEGLIDWVSSMTYQAASGAGAKNMQELLSQMSSFSQIPMEANETILDYEKRLNQFSSSSEFPIENFKHPLALNLLPWIDSDMENGQTKEEWKGEVEANKILNTQYRIPIDGTCVRVGSLRCHAQAFTIKLNKSVDIYTIENLIANNNDWVSLIPNTKEDTLKYLTPMATSGSLDIPIGRVRKLTLGDDFLGAFTVGDQLLWGASEPLRRMLKYLI